MSDFRSKVGQLFIIGFHGEEPSQEFLDFLRKEQISGVILFEENCPSHEKTRENIAQIREACDSNHPFIAIDQEGGRICRLRGVPAEFRSAEEYGQGGNVDQFREDYSRSVIFMESIGINLNFAPVCDIFTNPMNTCLEGRCFGKNHREVQPFVVAAVETAKNAGVLSCLKHFPGLGASTIDPHKQTARADYDELIWTNRERIPFAAGVATGADIIMTTHLLLSSIDDTIVTGSKKIVTSLIRDALGFDGPIITDDLTMAGADILGEIGPRTVRAFEAGHDLLLFGNDFELASSAYDYFCSSVRHGKVNEEHIQRALDRISGIKFKLDSSVLR